MNLTQALKGNMGDPAGENLHTNYLLQEALVSRKEQDKTERKGMSKQACRKSDEAIVVTKFCVMRNGAKGFGYLSEHLIEQL